jgi:hypothetical protein
MQAAQDKIKFRSRAYFKIWATAGATMVATAAYFTWVGILLGTPVNVDYLIVPFFIAYLALFGVGIYAGKLNYGSNDKLAASLFVLGNRFAQVRKDEPVDKNIETEIAKLVTTVGIHKRNLKEQRAQELVNSNAVRFLTNLRTILLKANRISRNHDATECNSLSTNIAAIAQMVHLGNLNSSDILTLTDTTLTNLQATEELAPQSPIGKLPSAIGNQLSSSSKLRLGIEIPVAVIFAIILGSDNATRAIIALAALTLIIAIETWQRPKKK